MNYQTQKYVREYKEYSEVKLTDLPHWLSDNVFLNDTSDYTYTRLHNDFKALADDELGKQLLIGDLVNLKPVNRLMTFDGFLHMVTLKT
jgi:hypothetical protein